MNPDQKFFDFVQQWAKKRGWTFEIQACDGRESSDLIDGMAVDDVWGWMLPEGTAEKNNDNFGCLEWSVVNGKLMLQWNAEEN